MVNFEEKEHYGYEDLLEIIRIVAITLDGMKEECEWT